MAMNSTLATPNGASRIPERASQWETRAPRQEAPAASERSVVLVVEDDPAIAELLDELLDSMGYAVLLARNGAAALALLRRERPGLVLTDRMMPELDGVELVRRLRQSHSTRDIPVVIMTSAHAGAVPADYAISAVAPWLDDATRALVTVASFDGVVVPIVDKPFDIDDLLAIVDAAMRSQTGALDG